MVNYIDDNCLRCSLFIFFESKISIGFENNNIKKLLILLLQDDGIFLGVFLGDLCGDQPA